MEEHFEVGKLDRVVDEAEWKDRNPTPSNLRLQDFPFIRS